MTAKQNEIDEEMKESELEEFITKFASNYLTRFDSTGRKCEAAMNFAAEMGVDIKDQKQLIVLMDEVNFLKETMLKKMIKTNGKDEKDSKKASEVYEELQDIYTGFLGILLNSCDKESDCKS